MRWYIVPCRVRDTHLLDEEKKINEKQKARRTTRERGREFGPSGVAWTLVRLPAAKSSAQLGIRLPASKANRAANTPSQNVDRYVKI